MTARTLAALACAFACLAPAGCASAHKRKIDRKVPHLGVVDASLPRELKMVSQPPHVIEPPDVLEITVRPTALNFETVELAVQPEGIVDFGLLGEVYVAGLTLEEAELKVAAHFAPLAASRNVAGQLAVSVRNVTPRDDSSKRYYVIGAVRTQGSFPLTGNDTVADAILGAGLRPNSLPEKAYLSRPRPCGGAPQVYRIEWEAIKLGDTVTNYQLFPGDRVIVPGGPEPGLLQTLLGGG